MAVCSGGRCGVQCIDSVHCGSNCFDCRQPNAVAACGTTAPCANSCVGTALACARVNGKPSCGTWNFESGDSGNEGWSLDIASNGSTGPVSITSIISPTGSHALAIPYENKNGNSGRVGVQVRLCLGGGNLDLSGK